MNVEEARKRTAGLLDTPRPAVTQRMMLRPVRAPVKRSRMERWLISLGLGGLLAIINWPLCVSVASHAVVLFLLALGKLQYSGGTGGGDATVVIQADTVIAAPGDFFESGPIEADSEPKLGDDGGEGGMLASAPEVDPLAALTHQEADPAAGIASGSSVTNEDFLGNGTGTAGDGEGGVLDGLENGGGGGIGGTEFFNIAASGKRILYVIDRSQSMTTNRKWEAAVEELIRSIDTLPLGVDFQVLFYSDEPMLLRLPSRSGRLAVLNDETRLRARREILEIKPIGGTNHEKALLKAVQMKPEVIFLLTDAEHAEPDMAKKVTQRNRSSGKRAAKINVIQFQTDPTSKPDKVMERLAQENHGSYQMIEYAPSHALDRGK
ncbi:MAG: VWA domain-containing protein [Planctomycetota bacterium]